MIVLRSNIRDETNFSIYTFHLFSYDVLGHCGSLNKFRKPEGKIYKTLVLN